MAKSINRVSKKSGMIPGSVVHIGKKLMDQARLEMIDFTPDEYAIKDLGNLDECKPIFNNKDSVSWLNITGLHDTELIQNIGTMFSLDSLVLEDIVNTKQRPKSEEFDNCLFFTLKMIAYNESKGEVTTEQVSFILAQQILISFQEREGDVFTPVRLRIKEAKGRVRAKKGEYLLYALIDVIIDEYYGTLEQIGDRLEQLEEDVLENPSQDTLQQIQLIKRELISLRKAVFPLREAISMILRGESEFIHEKMHKYFRDLHDNSIAVIETVETYKEQLGAVKDLYLSSLSNKMNNIMKVLTIMASIFIPLTFVAGIYGMNFKILPETKWDYGYLYFWALILVITAGMVWYFKRKDWL